MTWLPEILTAYGILMMGIATPGPAVAMLLGIASNDGRAAALITCGAIGVGSMVLNLITMVGLGVVMEHALWALVVLKVIGASYLAWLGYGCFKRALNPPKITAQKVSHRSMGQYLAKGFLMQVTNPKAMAFWLAIGTVAPIGHAGPSVVIPFVVVGGILSGGGHALWALALSSSPVQRAYASARRWIEGLLGTFFTIAAVSLARFQR